MKGPVQQVGQIVEVIDAGAALRDASGSIMNSGFDIAADLLLLFDLAYRELLKVSV